MANNAVYKYQKSFTVLGQALVVPTVSELVLTALGLAIVLLAIGSLGGPASVPGFIFGCGVMWLVMAGLDLRRPKAWALVLAWILVVFSVSLVVSALFA